MNKTEHPSYKKSFLLAVSFHCMVLLVILFSHTSKHDKPLVQNEVVSAQMLMDVPPVTAKAAPVEKKIKPEPDNTEIQKEAQKAIELERIKQEKIAKLEKLEKERQEKLEKLEKAKQEKLAKLQKERIEKEKQEKQEKLAQAKKEQAERERIAKEQALAAEHLAQAAQQQSDHQQLLRTIDRYALLMRAKITQNWRRPLGVENIYTCKVAVKLRSNGEVMSAMVVASSGNIEFDRSAELAVRKASPLPMPPDEKMRAPFNQFTFTFDPESA